MDGFKKNPKIACFKEGGQVGYKSRKTAECDTSDAKQDKTIVKKAVGQHESAKHKGEGKTELKLKTGGRCKKEGGNVRKYSAGKAVGAMASRLKDNVMGTPEQNASAQARMDAVEAAKTAAKGQGAVSDAERKALQGAGMKGQGAISDAERSMVTKKRGGKC